MKAKGDIFPYHTSKALFFLSKLHVCRPVCFVWEARCWHSAQEFKQNLRVFYGNIPVSFLITSLHCRKMNLIVVEPWKGWTHVFPSPGLRCHFFCLALLFSTPSGEPLQGVPFLHKAYPFLLPSQRKTFCCFRPLSWIPINSEEMLLLWEGGSCQIITAVISNCIATLGNLLSSLGSLTSVRVGAEHLSCLMEICRILTF